MKTHIASLVYGDYPCDSRVRRMAEALVRHGYSVDVIALRSLHGSGCYKLKGVTVHELPLAKKRGGAGRYLLQYGLFLLLSFFWLTALYIRKRFAVIHVNNMPNIIVYSCLVPKLFGAKVILDIHDPFPELYAIKAPPEKRERTLKWLKREERVSLAYADHVICTTDLIQEAVIQRGAEPSKTSVVINAPDETIFRRPVCEGRGCLSDVAGFTVLYAGTVVERYGVTNIVRAVSLLRDEIPDLKFRVIGLGDGMERLKQVVSELDADDLVEILPHKTVEEIPAEYARADAVFWFPQRNEFIDIILCVKVLEALSMGLPVISTRTMSHAHYFAGGEVSFVDSLKPKDLAAAIYDLYANYSERKPTYDATKKFISRFGWDTEQKKYLKIIECLCRSEAALEGVRRLENG